MSETELKPHVWLPHVTNRAKCCDVFYYVTFSLGRGGGVGDVDCNRKGNPKSSVCIVAKPLTHLETRSYKYMGRYKFPLLGNQIFFSF